MTNTSNEPKTFFWIIAFVALLWNIMGVVAYLGHVYITEETLAKLPEADQLYYANVPAWVTAAFATAVFSGTFGSIALLMRKKWATFLLILSMIMVFIQSIYNFFIQDFMEITSENGTMPLVILVITIFLVWFSKNLERKGILS